MIQSPALRRYNYLRAGAEIYRRSFATIRSEAELSRFAPDEEHVAVRMIHACGMVDIAPDIVFSKGAVERARQALRQGAPVLCDSRMLASGIIAARLPRGNEVLCTLGDPAAATLAQDLGTTRSAAAVELWRGKLDGAIAVIGNAPTALFHLLEMLPGTEERPACIVGMPVGFVGAAESKDALIAGSPVPFITLRGRRGGSAVAAAALNAIASEAL
ncbi:MAG TPA: precorrin-8X methylmutase [Methylocella sp.]|nr:precorrin-8X methylmutase [Methylocella sp.]